MKILNFGSLNYDYVYSVDHILQPGETLASTGMEKFCGGKGLNQSIALARAGINVYHAGVVGFDGDDLIKVCSQNGIDYGYVLRDQSAPTGHTIIQVNKAGQNCILLYGGCNQRSTKDHIDYVLDHFTKGDMILLQNEINLIDYIIDCAYKKGMTIVLNPSPYNEQMNKCNLNKVSVFLMNEIEGEQITGEQDPNNILEVMHKKFPYARIVLTLGRLGAVYRDQKQTLSHGIYNVPVVDTTGAGDTFCGYFIASILKQSSIEQALNNASVASSLSVSRKGATASIPFLEEVQNANLPIDEL